MKKRIFTLLTACAVLCTMGLAACGEKEEEENNLPPVAVAHVHNWTETKTTDATCGEAGRKYYSCECGATKTERTGAATHNHNFGDDKECDDCGYIDMSGMTKEEAIEEYGYYVLDEDESQTYTTGDIVFYGSYPQILVNKGDIKDATHVEEGEGEGVEDDEELIASLNAKAGTLPTASSNGDWTSYGYYSEGQKSDYAFYKDIEVDGTRYRGVYLLNYRSYYAKLEASADYSYIDEEGYSLNTIYWFEYSPIRWIVLDYIEGNLLINSLECLEAQPYQDLYIYDETAKEAYIPNTTTYINDWEASSLRNYLNGTFIENAFSADEQELIQKATVQNKYSGYAADAKYQITQKDTEDKVFILSWEELSNTQYGFPDVIDYDDAIQKEGHGENADDEQFADAKMRRRSFTEYSTIQGLHRSTVGHTESGDGACRYIVRSAGILSYGICGVSKYGSLMSSGQLSLNGTESYDSFAANGNLGITPSLYIKVGK